MRIINARVFDADAGFVQRDVCVEDGRFAQTEADGCVLDAQGAYLAPGFIDIHFHGCAGFDLCDAGEEALRGMSAFEARRGVTAICPATMSLGKDALMAVCESAADFSPANDGAALVGLNMEGPFIAMNKRGAQNPEYIVPPDIGMFRELQAAANGLIRLCDIAPEVDGAAEFIEALRDAVRISVAHTEADYATAMRAYAGGARHLTHMFNAMPPLLHRSPGVIGAAFDAGATVELIADGVHVHESAVRAAFAMFGKRLVLISDSMRAAGLADGQYTLGGLYVTVAAKRATLADGTIAGGVCTLADCVKTAINDMRIPPRDAIYAATLAPAKCIGADAERGSIEAGKIADAVLLDDEFTVRGVLLRGRMLA